MENDLGLHFFFRFIVKSLEIDLKNWTIFLETFSPYKRIKIISTYVDLLRQLK